MSTKHNRTYDDLYKINQDMKNLLNAEGQEERERLEGSFYAFVRAMWPWSGTSEEFCPGWHIDALCEHLEALYRRDIRNLLINISPRTGKSSLTAVLFPAWVWANNPQERFLCASYAQILSVRDSTYCRRLIMSDAYQKLWGFKVSLTGDVNSKLRFENTKGGMRIATSVGGSTTGEGASIRLIDDAYNSVDVDSETIRESTNDWFDKAWSTRGNDPKTSCQLVTQQRLHERDLSGHIMSKTSASDWVELIIPMEAEMARRCITVPLKSTEGEPWIDPREHEGELMWPERMNRDNIEKLKRELGSEYTISGQLQQNPSPAEGGIIKKSYFVGGKSQMSQRT